LPPGRSERHTLSQNPQGTSRDHVLGFTRHPASQVVTRSASNEAYAWTGGVAVSRGQGRTTL